MATHIDVLSMQNDPSKNALADSRDVDHTSEREPGNIASTEGLVQGKVLPLSLKVHVTDGSGTAPQEQSPRHLSPPKTGNIDDHLCCALHQSDFDPVNPPEEFSELEAPVDPAVGTPSINTNDGEGPMVMDPQGPPVLCPNIASPIALPRDEKEADAGDPLLDVAETACPGVTDEEGDQEDVDCLFDEIPSPLPPSSSPPQLFSSSPYVSSQSSLGDVESSKTGPAVETLDRANVSDDRLVLVVAQDDCQSELEDIYGTVEAASGSNVYCSQVVLPPGTESASELSRKRVADSDPHELCGLRPIKHPNLDSHPCLPPAPKRATAASQRHQFKKLAAPFRPPLKLSIDGDQSVQASEERKAELTTNVTPETRRDETNRRGSSLHSQRRTPNTPKSVAQFKSPLVHGTALADSRAVRLTPALQMLERRLQLLKRAIKVKEDNEEEVLVRLSGKWIEAGREVAYEVWDAVKDTGDFAGKATFMRRSQGWESTDNARAPWGWDTKRGDADEDSGDPNSSEVACTGERQAPEEDDDVGYNTLGTVLRQLGIAPEIFGWDDEKEAFSD